MGHGVTTAEAHRTESPEAEVRVVGTRDESQAAQTSDNVGTALDWASRWALVEK